MASVFPGALDNFTTGLIDGNPHPATRQNDNHDALNAIEERLLGRAINVVEHGATGDGSTNDTAAIQAAITAAGTNGAVVFPKPAVFYSVPGTLTVANNGVTLLSENQAELRGNANVTMISVTGTDVVIRGLTIRGSGVPVADGSTVVMFETDAHRGKVLDCRLFEPPAFCLGFTALIGFEVSGCLIDPNRSSYTFGSTPQGDGIFMLSAIQGRIVGNYIRNAIIGIWGGTQFNVTAGDENDSYNRDVTIVGNVFDRNWAHCNYIYGRRITIANNAFRHDRVAAPLQTGLFLKGHGDHFTVVGNTGRSNRGLLTGFDPSRWLVADNNIQMTTNDTSDCIGFERVNSAGPISNITVRGNRLVSDAAQGRDGIYINATYSGFSGPVSNISITDNHIENFSEDSIDVECHSTNVGDVVKVSGNTIINPGVNGVRVVHAKNVMVTDNLVRRAGTAGVYLDGVITRALVTGNALVDDAGAPTMDYGVRINNASSTQVAVRDNFIHGATTAEVSTAAVAAITPTLASAATLPVTSRFNTFLVSGTTTITGLTIVPGHWVVLVFTSTAQMTDNGTTLNLAGNFTGAANRTIRLVCDGTNWYENGRSAN